MTRRTIDTLDYIYTVAPDVDLPVAQRMWAMVIAQLTDELNGNAPDGPIRLACDNHNFITRVGAGGFVGLAGVPATVVPLLRLQNYPVTLSVFADGYVPDSQQRNIPFNLSFPTIFTPLDLGIWALHREPTSIFGSVNLATSTGALPVAGASLTVTSLWRQVGQPAVPFDVLTLSGILAAARPAASTVQQVTMTPAGPAYQLVSEAEPASSSVLLSNTVGLGPGSVLGFDVTDPDRAEFATVASISGSVVPTQPAIVTLTLPLGFLHFALIPVTPFTPVIGGPANTVAVDAIAGDRVLLLNQPVTGIATGDVVAITGGGAPVEYQTADLFAATSDALGNYRLPLLSRVAQLDLKCDDGVHAPVTQRVIPQYGIAYNRVDFLLS